MDGPSELTTRLHELRDGQQRRLEACEAQLARVERIDDRAEVLRERAGRSERVAAVLLLPGIVVLMMLIYGARVLHGFGGGA